MEEYITFTLSSVGLTLILVWSSFFKPLRELITKKRISTSNKIFSFLDSIFSCCQCMGFWAGVILYIPVFREMSYNIIIFGFISSLLSMFIAAIIVKLEE